jgi:CRP/FNR family transcriptional regulator, cyclic AMP receptor protein
MSTHAQEFESLALWANLSPSERSALKSMCGVLRLAGRAIVVKENAPFAGLHIIQSGNVKLCKMCGDKEQILDVLGPGDVIDPIPLFDGGSHAVSAKAMTPTILYRFTPDAAHKLIAAHPSVLNALLNIVSLRLRKLATLANDLAFKDVTARICHVLLELLASKEASKAPLLVRPLTRQELAAMVGTAREVAWRSLKKLERDGLIEIHGQQIVILDAAALASRA